MEGRFLEGRHCQGRAACRTKAGPELPSRAIWKRAETPWDREWAGWRSRSWKRTTWSQLQASNTGKTEKHGTGRKLWPRGARSTSELKGNETERSHEKLGWVFILVHGVYWESFYHPNTCSCNLLVHTVNSIKILWVLYNYIHIYEMTLQPRLLWRMKSVITSLVNHSNTVNTSEKVLFIFVSAIF